MPREFKRADRVADAIQRSVAQLIQTEMSDPRLGLVNINHVEVTKDLAIAKIYVTFIGKNTEESKEATEVLNNAANYLRNLVSKDIVIRATPRLNFFYDVSMERGLHMSRLIDEAVSRDSDTKNADESE